MWSARGLVLALYVGALALLPASHHDLSCHLTSSTHCTVCQIGPSGERPASGAASVVGAPSVDLGSPFSNRTDPILAPAAYVTAGRAPPAR